MVLTDPASEVRFYAVSSLDGASQNDPVALDALVTALTRDPDACVRWRATSAIKKNTTNPSAIAALVMALADPNAAVRDSAATALSGTDNPVARAALELALKDKNGDVRWHATTSPYTRPRLPQP
jgi:HEAT repeat protein